MRGITFLILLFPLFLFSQEKKIEGVVLDSKTEKPVPYASVSILKKSIGTSSNENGEFTLKVSENDVDEDILITSLGYKNTIVPIRNFFSRNKVFITSKVEQLQEVVVSSSKEKEEFIINPIQKKKINGGFRGANTPYILALYFPYEDGYDTSNYIKSISYRFFKYEKSKFRIRVFSIGGNGLPDRDILTENIIIEVEKGQKQIDVNISESNLQIPKEGVFIAFEWLYIPFNEYKEVYKRRNGSGEKIKQEIKYYSPMLGAKMREKGTFHAAEFFNGSWRKLNDIENDDSETGSPAISLILSN